ncbi:MAG: hypothetical protein CSYNP_04424 [Syntrophus sp. SKADARSKE-3]|nr:hypothetical protein [Syntrophus sp. SKADARSKE-3]
MNVACAHKGRTHAVFSFFPGRDRRDFLIIDLDLVYNIENAGAIRSHHQKDGFTDEIDRIFGQNRVLPIEEHVEIFAGYIGLVDDKVTRRQGRYMDGANQAAGNGGTERIGMEQLRERELVQKPGPAPAFIPCVLPEMLSCRTFHDGLCYATRIYYY